MDEGTIDVAYISNLLDVGKYKEAVSASHDKKFADTFTDNCWDLTSKVIKKIQDDTIVIKPSLYGTCEELLNIIIEKSTPEEALLEFIEQIELAKNDAQFGLILGRLQLLLKKLSIKKGRSLEWCLNSISTYIENIPTPEYQLEGKERLLMDCEPNIRRVTRVYSLLPTFYSPFIQQTNGEDSNSTIRQIITAFLISLMGKPLIYIDMDPDSHSESEIRLSCNTMIKDICVLEKNLLKFLCYLEKCNKENKSSKKVNENNDNYLSPYDNKDKINMTTLSGLFYVTFSNHFEIPDLAIPQVYSLEYLIHTVMLATNHLFSFTEYGPLTKGIQLLKVLLNYLNYHTSHTYLSFSVHFDICKSLVNIAIYSNYDTIRKNAVSLIGCHVNKFDYKGRCILIKYLLDISNHSGMIGYVITLYKDAIDEAMKEAILPDCFIGPQLLSMIKKICYLPHGAESDLVELADQIITALNFLRYLTIKDNANITGIKQCFTTIETDYLDKLRFGLNMSKAHYEVALKDLQDGKKSSEEKDKISINVGGNILDNIPIEKKKEIINSALNAFHLIEGLIARLSECINTNKMQGLNMDCE